MIKIKEIEKEVKKQKRKKITYGIIGILTILIGTGALLLSDAEIQKTYVCSSNLLVGTFSKLNVNHSVGYYTENKTTIKVFCPYGEWIPITEKYKFNSYKCDSTKCIPIN